MLSSKRAFAVVVSSMVTAYVLSGGAKHSSDIPRAQIPKVTKLNYITQAFNIMGSSTGKISAALLIYRLQAPSKWRTWVLVILSTLSFILSILVIIMFLAQCSPPRALWTPNAGTCWNPRYINAIYLAASSK